MDAQLKSPQKTRLLYVVESFSTGVYAIVRDIACNLDPEQFTILFLHSLRPDSPKTYEQDFKQPHISLQYVPMGSLKDYISAVSTIRKVIRTFNPEVIHLHSSKAGVLGRVAAKGVFSQTLLYSPHGFSFLRTDVHPWKQKVFLTLEILADRYKHAKIIAVSEGEREEALRVTSDTLVINNFIDTSLFNTSGETPENTVVTTGRIAPQKNPQLFNAIAQRMPEVAFLWVGDGPQRSELTASNITITGYVPRLDAIAHVTKSTLYLQTSLWEGMPVSILEAMAVGIPVVASDIIGNRDLIQPGVTGYLCNSSEQSAFVEHITELLSNKSLREEMGLQSRSVINQKYDIYKAIEHYALLYKG